MSALLQDDLHVVIRIDEALLVQLSWSGSAVQSAVASEALKSIICKIPGAEADLLAVLMLQDE